MRSKTHKHSLILQPWHGCTLLIVALLFLAAPSALADNPAGCGLTTINALADNCFTVTPPIGAVVIDGTRTGAEWTGAIQKNIAGPPAAIIRFRRDGVNLIFLISVNDTNNNVSDTIQLAFDPLHNHVSTVDDVIFTIRREGLNHQRTDSGGTSPWAPEGNLSVCPTACTNADFASGWQAEVVITPADLALPDLSAIIGFSLVVTDQDPPNPISDWPTGAASAATWANIKTRFPIEYMVVLDQSGSMLSQSKWVLAKSATNYLAKTMAIVGEPTYFLDQLGVVTFAWNNTTNTDATSTPKPLANVPVFAAGDFVPDPPVITPVGQNYTPIGEGLKEAFTALGIGVEETERVVLYLSDGLHNRPTTSVPLLPTVADLSYTACMVPGVWSMCTNSVVKVNTVALGQDSGVDTALLNQIKNGFSGECFGGGAACNATTYTITTDGDELKKFFIQSLDSLYQLNSLADGPANTQFPVNAGERRLIVISSWPAMVAPMNFILERSNDGVAWTDVSCSQSGASGADVGLAFCAVDTPTAAPFYRAKNNVGASRVFPLLDLKLRARFSIDQVVHGTGQDIVLRAALNEAGKPVTHDPATHPVKVTVSIKRPTEGFGTFVSTHDPKDCATIRPEPPPLRRGSPTVAAGHSQIDFSLTAAGMLAAATGPDVKPPRFDRIDTLFGRCGKNSLNVTEDPGLELFDDGTHGDATANDGIYTLRFVNTQFEGSYVLNFKASGKSPTGSEFSRVKTIAEYVRVKVDPGNTTINVRDVSQVGNIVTREYYVTPRDRFGGYLGPGYPDQVVFTTTAGSFVTPVLDYNNGVYSRVLQFDRSSENPVVTGTVQGEPLDPVSGFGGAEGFELFAYIGGSAYQNALGLNNGFTTGARFGYRFPNQFALEAEGGVTFSRFNFGPNTGQRAKLIHVLGNVRYDIEQWGIGNWTPYVIAGAGGVFLRGAGVNDSAFAVHTGFGSTWRLTNHVGIRADGRVFRFGALNGGPATTSFQGNVGVVFRF